MNEIIRIPPADILPDLEALLKTQKMDSSHPIRQEIRVQALQALALFGELAEPCALMMRIGRDEFVPIYEGLGRNDSPGPIERVYQQAQDMALFAGTIGSRICEKIAKLFRSNEFVVGNFLDAAASEGTDRISHLLEDRFSSLLSNENRIMSHDKVLAYSPGYCGWHISAQKALFAVLRPEQIGISLRDSFLMEPLKSISGVVVAGPAEIHRFEGVYPFCSVCRSQTCRARALLRAKD
jgi:hypothetical protein